MTNGESFIFFISPSHLCERERERKRTNFTISCKIVSREIVPKKQPFIHRDIARTHTVPKVCFALQRQARAHTRWQQSATRIFQVRTCGGHGSSISRRSSFTRNCAHLPVWSETCLDLLHYMLLPNPIAHNQICHLFLLFFSSSRLLFRFSRR